MSLGGQTTRENLCVACHSCNEFKRDLTVATDPDTGTDVPLFHPNRTPWRDHFRWSDDFTHVVGTSATGRATVGALHLNHDDIVEARRRWTLVGWYPPVRDL